jgi:hypothetical protein
LQFTESMKSKIQIVTPMYAKFESILPEQLDNTSITEELEIAKNEINSIINDDLKNIKNLAVSKNKAIEFNEFLKPPSIIKMAFYIDGDSSQDVASFHCAHWIMSVSTLQSLTKNVIDISKELKTVYTSYMDPKTEEKGKVFNHFVRSYHDFHGYLLNILNAITQYYDLFVHACNEIDPNNNEQSIIAYKSDISHFELLAATKELLLHGNVGRLVGFPLIRSALEVFITRELFNLKKSSKYNNNQITFLKKRVTSINTIIKVIEKLKLQRSFQIDSLKRLYDWQSIVMHRGIRTDEYLLWFIYEHTALEILAAFNANLKRFRDQILEELQNDKEIQIK